jgi:pilus assembly protein CpaB
MNPLRALFVSLSRIHPVVMLVVVLGIAVMVGMMVTGNISDIKKQSAEELGKIKAEQEQKTKVVYCKQEIAEGATIGSDAVEERDVPAGQAPVNALASTSQAVGRVAKYSIPAEQIMTQADLAPIGVTVGFESKVKAGFRAVTFPVDTNSGVAGFVNPGSHVDILATVGTGATTKAQPILSDVEVIAVGQTYQKQSGATAPSSASSVTVAVSPEEASKLIKAIMAGKLYLTLRNDKDHTPVAVVDVTSMFEKAGGSDISASLPPPGALPPPPLPGAPGGFGADAGAPPPPPLHEIEVWTGSKKDTLTVPRN